MGKTSKKSATKVEVAPAAAATKPLKKGKRDAEEVTEKQVPAKKQKQNEAALKQAIDKKKTEAKTQKKNKKDETSSEDDSSSESEEEVKVKPVAKKQVKKPVESSSEEDSSSDEVSAVAVAKNGSVAAKKKDETSDDSDSESEDESDKENETPAKVASKTAPAKVTNVSSKGKEDASESESDDESDSDEKPKVAGAKKDGSSEEDSSEEETSESEEEDKVPKTPKNKGGDVEMADAGSKKSNIKDALKTHSTPKVQSTGSKTLFMGNLSFSIEREDVENFFKDAGEIADVRFGSDSEGIFKGYGHVEFVTVEAAQKALKLNGQDLLGRQVKLDLARERGERGPASGNENSYQKGGRGQAQGQTIFVKGFDTSGGEEQVRSALEEHFGSCGDITRVSIPQDYEGGLKGCVYEPPYITFGTYIITDKIYKTN